ncbi:pectinesterase [Paenibacillus antibioticophila]|uniref:Pectinesterase n=1 Tax=Paenibacillus antibioticophila TaxID=1274374 RepID=A0A919XT71_9BACL|nr:pectinesterase [Paenibacillus antibioticophila]
MILVGASSFCHFRTIQGAVDFLEQTASGEQETICILPGIYEEQVIIYRSNLKMVGIGAVELTMNRYARELDEDGNEIGTFATPTLFLGGEHLVVENMTISNTAGMGEHIGQAVAVYAHCDQTVFRNCVFKGHQDTLFTGPLPPKPKERAQFGGVPIREQHDHYRQLYQNCYIEGTVDFIFGGATAYFDGCNIHSLLQAPGKRGYLTAASTPIGQQYGYVFRGCFITADPGVSEVFLGRPWREYAQTVFVNCQMSEHIHPLGWDHWNNPANEQTVDYREYGPAEMMAAISKSRVAWARCEALEEAADNPAAGYALEQVFAGTDFWRN